MRLGDLGSSDLFLGIYKFTHMCKTVCICKKNLRNIILTPLDASKFLCKQEVKVKAAP